MFLFSAWASAESHSQTSRSCHTPWLATSFLHVQSQQQGVQSFLCHICLPPFCPPLAHLDSVIRLCPQGLSRTSSPHQGPCKEQSQLWGWVCGHLSWKHYSAFLDYSDISSNVAVCEGSSLIMENIVFTIMIITCIYFAHLLSLLVYCQYLQPQWKLLKRGLVHCCIPNNRIAIAT